MELTKLQKEKVHEILDCYKNKKSCIQFKAPTGSGKTLMATNVIADLITHYPEEKFIFIIATLSSSSLPYAFERKINEYKSDLSTNNFEVEYIKSPSSDKTSKVRDYDIKIIPEKNKVYIFGKATFGVGRIITEQKVIEDFIQGCKSQNYKIIYIRDEAHIGSGEKGVNKESKNNFETLMNNNSDFIIQMIATFNKDTSRVRVELTEKDLNDKDRNEDKWLLKVDWEIVGYDENEDDIDFLKKAIKKFKEIKEDYKSLLEKDGILINPAMLIQVDNELKDEREEYKKRITEIKKILKEANLSWVQYFGNSDKDWSNVDNKDFTLSKITKNNNSTDVIIFKIGPSTGWDIPRACMLVQLRRVCSSNLNIQTIGRIKRNPYPNLKKNDITNKYYIYSTKENLKNGRDYFIYDYKVKKKFENEEMAVIKIKREKEDNLVKHNENKLKKEIDKFFDNNKKYIVNNIDRCFKNNIYKETDDSIPITSPLILLKKIVISYNNLNKEEKKIFKESYKIYKENFSDYKWEQVKLILIRFYRSELAKVYRKSIDLKNFYPSYKLVMETIKPNIYKEIFPKENNK